MSFILEVNEMLLAIQEELVERSTIEVLSQDYLKDDAGFDNYDYSPDIEPDIHVVFVIPFSCDLY